MNRFARIRDVDDLEGRVEGRVPDQTVEPDLGLAEHGEQAVWLLVVRGQQVHPLDPALLDGRRDHTHLPGLRALGIQRQHADLAEIRHLRRDGRLWLGGQENKPADDEIVLYHADGRAQG